MHEDKLFNEIASLNLPQKKSYYTSFLKLLLLRRSSEFLLIALLQYVGLMLSTAQHINMPIWPASGVSLGLLFLRGNRIIPGLFVGSFLAYLHSHYPLMLNLPLSFLLCLQAYLIRTAALNLIGPIIPFKRFNIIFAFCTLCFLMSSMITAGYYWVFTDFYQLSFEPIYLLQINFSNFCGILFFAPICFLWDNIIPTGKKLSIPWLKILFTFGIPAFSIILLLAMPTLIGFMLISLLSIPFTAFAIRFFHQIGLQMMMVVLSVFIISFIPTFLLFPEKLHWLIFLQIKLIIEWAFFTIMKHWNA